MNYDFIKSLTIVDTGRLRKPKKTNPDGMAIRIFANGEVYPSEELVNRLNLEYKNKPAAEEENPDRGFGFDVVDSSEWEPTKHLPRIILLGLVGRSKPKVDLFSLVRYNTDGTPKASVLNQGSTSTVLLDLVRSLGYLTPAQAYCDLVLQLEHPITPADGLAYIPKTIDKGVRKDEKTYERRENVVFYHAITPEALAEAQQEPAKAEEAPITETKPQ